MCQVVRALVSDEIRTLELPDSGVHVMYGVLWGRFDEIFSPAFWAAQAWLAAEEAGERHHRLGDSLAEEVAACLLGGYGMRSEVGIAVFEAIRDRGMLGSPPATEAQLCAELCRPVRVRGKSVAYRYPRQRSRYLAEALRRLSTEAAPAGDDIGFRGWLMTFVGIGPKTASWITRNWLGSDRVAILDVHVHRAGVLAGLFRPSESPGRDYFALETRLVEFAERLGVRLSLLDAVMWDQMRRMSGLALAALQHRRLVAA